MSYLTRIIIVSGLVILASCSSEPALDAPVDPLQSPAATEPGSYDPSLSPLTAQPDSQPSSPPTSPPAMPPAAPLTPTSPPPITPPPPKPTTSAPQKPNPILEEVPDPGVSTKESLEARAVNPAFGKLNAKLTELGYEGVGLEYESTAVLELLTGVFSSPDIKHRKIKRVYTGGGLEYDGPAEAITIGGTTNKAKILTFIKKKVPKRKP